MESPLLRRAALSLPMLLPACAGMPGETLRLSPDMEAQVLSGTEAFRLVNSDDGANYSYRMYVPRDQDRDAWTEQLRLHGVVKSTLPLAPGVPFTTCTESPLPCVGRGQARNSIADELAAYRADRASRCAQLEWRVLAQDARSATYEYIARDCAQMPEHHELGRVMDGTWRRFRMQWVQRGSVPIAAEPRARRLQWLQAADVIKVQNPPSLIP